MYTERMFEESLKDILGDEVYEAMKTAGLSPPAMLDSAIKECFVRYFETDERHPKYASMKILQNAAEDLHLSGRFYFASF